MQTTVVTIKADVAWRAERSSMSARWIGVCEELNLSMEAESLDELHSLIPETMHALMLDLLRDDELEQYLTERGWSPTNMPTHDGNNVEFDMPWHLIAEGQRGIQYGTC